MGRVLCYGHKSYEFKSYTHLNLFLLIYIDVMTLSYPPVIY